MRRELRSLIKLLKYFILKKRVPKPGTRFFYRFEWVYFELSFTHRIKGTFKSI